MRLFERKRGGDVQADDSRRKEKRIAKITSYLDANRGRLSTIPSIITKINQLSADRRAGAEEYAKVCEVDQSICMRLLCLSNSVYYGGSAGNHIRTVRDAIVRIGFHKARDVIQSAAVAGLFKSREKVDSYSAGELWMNSAAVAAGNRALCAEHDIAGYGLDPYLFGLLRNIGIPILHLCFYHDGFKDAVMAASRTGALLIEEEENYIGINHQEVGLEVARQWKLPPSLFGVIGGHHDPDVANDASGKLIHITRVSEWAAFELGLGYSDFSARHASFFEESIAQTVMSKEIYNRLKDVMQTEVDQLRQLGWFSGLSIARVH